jgi:hypothetical protein
MSLLAACYTGPSSSHYVALIEGLDDPAEWQVAKTVVRGPDQPADCSPFLSNECPAAIRTYSVTRDLEAAFTQAKDVITGAGFSVTDESKTGCSSGSTTGRPCIFFAERGTDRVVLRVPFSLTEAGLEHDVPGAAAVVVRALEY